MKRRGFLGLLGGAFAAPFIKNAALADSVPANAAAPTAEAMSGTIYVAHQRYRYVQAHRMLKAGDVVCLKDGRPFGIAVNDIPNGQYGVVQVGGPAEVNLSGVE